MKLSNEEFGIILESLINYTLITNHDMDVYTLIRKLEDYLWDEYDT